MSDLKGRLRSELDAGILGTLLCYRALKGIGAPPLVRPEIGGNSTHEGLVFARRDSGIKDIDGLGGEAIPLRARILAVADTFNTRTAERPYRITYSKAHAMDEIRQHAGTQFDSRVVEAFLRMEPLAALPSDGKHPVTEAIHEQVMS